MNLTLIRPTLFLEKEFIAAINDFRMNGEIDIEGLFNHCDENFQEYVLQTQLIEAGKTFTNMIVPFSTYWTILDQKRIIGFSHIRHYLTPALRIEGGHIGYSICPSDRQKGYGKQQLQLIINECRNVDINEVLITCDFDNIASYKIIEANGGIKIGEAISPRSKKVVFHYQIQL